MTVAAIFKTLGQHSIYLSREGAATLQELLSSRFKVVAEEAVRQLVEFVPKPDLSISDAAGLLLASLSSSDSVRVPLLVNGLVELFRQQANGSSQPQATWRAHLLSKTLCAHQDASYQLMECIDGLLLEINANFGKQYAGTLWIHLRPFLSYSLLDHGPQGEQLLFASGVHSRLCRLPHITGIRVLHVEVLELLASHLPCFPLRTSQERTFAVQAAVELVKSLERAQQEADSFNESRLSPGTRLSQQIMRGIMNLCFELKAQGSPSRALERLLRDCYTHSTRFTDVLVLEVALLVHNHASPAEGPLRDLIKQLLLIPDQPNLAMKTGLLLSQTIHTMVFEAPPAKRGWAAHLLAQLEKTATYQQQPMILPAVHKSFERPDLSWGICALHHVCCSLLSHFFSAGGGATIRWLQSLQAGFRQAASARSSASRAALPHLAALSLDDAQPTLCEPLVLALPALLSHPEPAVQIEAARTLCQAVRAVPLLGISFLPLIVYHVQRSVARDKTKMTRAEKEEAARVELALLRAIPGMVVHSAALPFVNRALDQLLPTGSPEAMQALLLRLRTQLWLGSGHGFHALSDALLGTGGEIPSKAQRESVELRVAQAACLRDVCAHDVGKGHQLLEGIQDCLGSNIEGEAALALEALALLVERDALKFQQAWAVVQRRAPSLPSQDLVAAAWLALLAHAHRDAEKHPEQFGRFQEVIWQATSHPSPQVRAAAYMALARCPLQTLELLELAKPLQQYSRLLLAESDASALQACEALVIAALTYEHSRRRGYVVMAAKEPSTSDTQKAEDPLLRRLTKVLPRQLCKGADGAPGGATSPGALLMCWAPPAPPAASETRPAEHARAAAAAYRAHLADILAAGPATSGVGVPSSELLLDSWKRFLSRWMGALKAAAHSDGSVGQGEAAALAAAEEVWQTLLQVIDEGTVPAADEALYAAGALASLHQASKLCAAILQRVGNGIIHAQSDASIRAHTLALAATLGCETMQLSAAQRLLAIGAAQASYLAAATEASGVACVRLCSEQPHDDKFISSFLESLLWRLCRTSSFFAQGNVRKTLPSWDDDGQGDESGEVRTISSESPADISGILRGVAGAVHCVSNVGRSREVDARLTALLQDCRDAIAALSDLAAAPDPASEGACIVLPALVTTMLARGLDPAVQAVLSALRGLVTTLHLPGQLVGTAATAVGCLVSGLAGKQPLQDAQSEVQQSVDALLAALGNAHRLAQSSAAKSGIACGLAALLGAPHLLPGVLPTGGTAFLLASPEMAEAAKQALQALEVLALKESNSQVRRMAAWALAAAAVSARGGARASPAAQPGGAQASANARALQSVPEEGAMRCLLQYALDSASQSGEPERAAAVLHCLAATERLPPINVGDLCSSFLQRAQNLPILQSAAVVLALQHPDTPGTGAFLYSLFDQSLFVSLALCTRVQLLGGLDCAVRASPAHAAPVLLSVPQLCSCNKSQPSVGPTGTEALQLQVAAWQGLQKLLSSSASPSSGSSGSTRGASAPDISDAVYQTMEDLFSLLPSPPPSLPGEEAEMHIGQSARSEAEQASSRVDAPGGPPEPLPAPSVLGLWTAALQCLKAANTDKVLFMLPCSTGSPAAAGQVYARAMLVRWGVLPLIELHPCRTWCISEALEVSGPVMAAVSRSTAALPHTQKQQMLMECLDLVTVCEHPMQAFSMAALLVATWLAQLHHDAGEAHITTSAPPFAVAALSYTLPSLLTHPQWRLAADAVAQRLAAIAQHPVGSVGVHADIMGKGDIVAAVLEFARACVIGMRNLLTPSAWKLVSVMDLNGALPSDVNEIVQNLPGLLLLPPPILTGEEVEMEAGPNVRSSPAAANQVYARAMLVWTWCISEALEVNGSVMAAVTRLTAPLPHMQKQQMLMECLHSSRRVTTDASLQHGAPPGGHLASTAAHSCRGGADCHFSTGICSGCSVRASLYADSPPLVPCG
ncbi:g11763 [Coccomyxa elongata]